LRWPSLHPRIKPTPVEVVEEPVVEFDPEAGKASENPFHESLKYGEDSTVKELKELLKAKELPVSGTKAELIARLEASETEVIEEVTTEDDEEAPADAAASEEEVSKYVQAEETEN
tara:strand:- start:442 stop:789 length:348 start_codon:yes stop_codon:yes gene_type:complete